MGKSISPKQIQEIFSLRNEGKSYAYISRKLGVSQPTVRNRYLKEKKRIESGELSKEELAEAMATDRTKMFLKDVAKKYGYSERHVTYITIQSPLRDKFLRKSSVSIKPKNSDRANEMAIDRTKMSLHQVAEKYGISPRSVSNLTRGHELKDKFKQTKKIKKPKPKELKKPKTKRDKIESLETINVGHLKSSAVTKTFTNREFDMKQQRHIFIPQKNMTVSVSLNDKRSNQEIINSFLEKDKQFIEYCKNNYMNGSHARRGK